MSNAKLHIIHDTREQKPLFVDDDRWLQFIKIGRDTLSAGDYSVAGHDLPTDDDSIILERKADCVEFATNLVAKWETFQQEMEKISRYRHKQIIVCKPENFAWLYDNGFTQVHPRMFLKRISEIYLDYGVSTVFLNSRQTAARYMYSLLRNVAKKHNDYA